MAFFSTKRRPNVEGYTFNLVVDEEIVDNSGEVIAGVDTSRRVYPFVIYAFDNLTNQWEKNTTKAVEPYKLTVTTTGPSEGLPDGTTGPPAGIILGDPDTGLGEWISGAPTVAGTYVMFFDIEDSLGAAPDSFTDLDGNGTNPTPTDVIGKITLIVEGLEEEEEETTIVTTEEIIETTDDEGETTKETKTVTTESRIGHKWEQKTLGQNKKIQEVVASAAKASELLNANMAFAKGGIQAAQLFLTTVMNPKVIILNTIADAIDTFVEDFLGTGFYILEVVPEGSETVPKNADGNPITLALAPAAIAANYATALGMGLGTEFKEWTTAYFGKADPNDLTAEDLKEVPQGNSKPLGKRVNDANSDRISPMEGVFGFPAMTPSQVIATMIAAIDDPLDDQRPTFSANVEVGAVIMIMGFSNFAVNVGDFRATIQAMVDFFGGENGMFTEGMKKMGKIFEAALGQQEDPTKHDITVQLVNVSGVRGTEEDLELLEKMGKPANFPAHFTLNDFIVGPRIGALGARAIGYISKADEDDITEDEGNPNSDPPILPNKNYVNQKVTIRGATEADYLAMKQLFSGAQIQRAHFYKSRNSYVDQNTSKPIIGEYSNDFKLFDELPFTYNDPEKPPKIYTAESATTKVERASKKAAAGTEFDPFLSPVGKGENVLETIGQERVNSPHVDQMRDIIRTKDIIGTVLEAKKPVAPHPNFKNATLEDLIGDFKQFFGAIQTFTNTLRDIAKDTSGAIADMVKFLDDSIKDLDKINEDLQKVLKLSTTGLPDTGVYVLTIPPDGVAGIEGLKEAIGSATNPPPDTLSHSVGFVMIGDKVSTGILTDLLAP